MFMRRNPGDYDHLARVKEWSLTSGAAEDGGERMSDRKIPDAVIARQIEAADPDVSAWVSANAGSGKTYVLAQRVIRLLLDGTDPAKILCLTYTKAAAANMANRVFERLAGWTTLDDSALEKEIRKTGLKRVDAKRLARARKLFAEALETPGGLKVQTIHAFCTRLLQQFPFEADVAARFEVLDETQQKQMVETIRLDVLLAAAAKPDSPEGRALATIIALASDLCVPDRARRSDPGARSHHGMARAGRRHRRRHGGAVAGARDRARGHDRERRARAVRRAAHLWPPNGRR